MTDSIAYLAPKFPMLSETFVYREVRALRSRGWTVTAVSLRTPDEGASMALGDLVAGLVVVYDWKHLLGVPLEMFRFPLRCAGTLLESLRDAVCPGESMSFTARAKLASQAVAGIALAHSLRQRHARHIHCHFSHAPSTVGMYAAKQLGISFSFTGHANDLFQRRALLKRKLERARFVACISRWHAQFYRDIVPKGDETYPIVRCGVDVSEWQFHPRASLLDNELRLLSVCRLVKKKGIATLLRAIAQVNRPVRLSVAGDGPERANLEALAQTLGCSEQVRWLGAIDNEIVTQLMQQAHAFVLPCQTDPSGDRDGLPVVLMEAMASGLPVVSGRLPAICELVENGSTGILVEGTDHVQLASVIENLTDETLQTLAEAGRAKVEMEFSLEGTTAKLEQYFTVECEAWPHTQSQFG